MIARNFGESRKNKYRHLILYLPGKYHNFKDVDWHQLNRLVFVYIEDSCISTCKRSMDIKLIFCGIDTDNVKPISIPASTDTKNDIHPCNKRGLLIIAVEPCQARSRNGQSLCDISHTMPEI